MTASPLWIKICGLTDPGDAAAAAAAGADLLGFVFASSPRRLDPARAAGFWAQLPPSVPRVGVFRDQERGEVEAVLSRLSLDYLQFHGGESPDFCAAFGLPLIRAFSPRGEGDLKRMEAYDGRADLFLVDLPKEGAGAGPLAPAIAAAAVGSGRPVILAGGLDAENVAYYVRAFRPRGVDVARGVESSPGRKDREKVRLFVERARAAAELRSGPEGGEGA